MTKATPVTELTTQELKRRLDHLTSRVWQMRLELHERNMQKRYEGKEHLLKSFTVHTDLYRAFEVQALDEDDAEHLFEWYDGEFFDQVDSTWEIRDVKDNKEAEAETQITA
jgi:cytolysin (calcineurin-like family phosphatase)